MTGMAKPENTRRHSEMPFESAQQVQRAQNSQMEASVDRCLSVDENQSVLMDMSRNEVLGAKIFSPIAIPCKPKMTLEDQLANLSALSTEELEQVAWQMEGREKILIQKLGQQGDANETLSPAKNGITGMDRPVMCKTTSAVKHQRSKLQEQKAISSKQPPSMIKHDARKTTNIDPTGKVKVKHDLSCLPAYRTSRSSASHTEHNAISLRSALRDGDDGRRDMYRHNFKPHEMNATKVVPKGFRISSAGTLIKITDPIPPHLTGKEVNMRIGISSEELRSRGKGVPRASPVPNWLLKRKEQLLCEQDERLEQERHRIRAMTTRKQTIHSAASETRKNSAPHSNSASGRSFISSIDRRLVERAKWEKGRKRREAILEAERTALRLKLEQEDDQAYRLERQRTVIRANAVPFWMYNATA